MRTPDLIDDHFYNTPRAMERTSNQYDNLPLGRAFIWVRIFEGFPDREQIRPLETEEAPGTFDHRSIWCCGKVFKCLK
jgi:hypothetical protein